MTFLAERKEGKIKKWIKAHSRLLKIIIVSLLLAQALGGVIILPSESWKWGYYAFASIFWIIVLLWFTGVISKIVEWWDKD